MKLKDWLKQEKRTQTAFAAEIGVPPSLLSGYIKGSKWPGRDKIERIYRATEGAVTANDFADLEMSEAG